MARSGIAKRMGDDQSNLTSLIATSLLRRASSEKSDEKVHVCRYVPKETTAFRDLN